MGSCILNFLHLCPFNSLLTPIDSILNPYLFLLMSFKLLFEFLLIALQIPFVFK